jgi:NAD-dependent SIR2 family protein deacetylase
VIRLAYERAAPVSASAPLPAAADLPALARLLRSGDVMILSGAGLSTDSGIPDYRGPSGSLRRSTPMTYQTFTADPAARRRYWARSYLGWRQIADAQPNPGHRAVAELQRRGRLLGIVTQNVDGLHQAAGARDVLELHGGLDRVVCLSCGGRERRALLDFRLRVANPRFAATVAAVNPDGDAELADADLDCFRMVGCCHCGSELVKPDVIFFGENVPRGRVDVAYTWVESARALVVLGSSLTVMSGFRFVRRAASLGIPVAIVNQGPTRGDDLADVRIDAPLSAVLPRLI